MPADAVAKRYRPWPKGLRADSLPWFDSPLVQGASRLRYTDKAQIAATGPYWPKGARKKKKTARADAKTVAESAMEVSYVMQLSFLLLRAPFGQYGPVAAT